MKEKPFESKPTLGIRIVLIVLCMVAGVIAAYYLFQ
jgi:hypothetical protein